MNLRFPMRVNLFFPCYPECKYPHLGDANPLNVTSEPRYHPTRKGLKISPILNTKSTPRNKTKKKALQRSLW